MSHPNIAAPPISIGLFIVILIPRPETNVHTKIPQQSGGCNVGTMHRPLCTVTYCQFYHDWFWFDLINLICQTQAQHKSSSPSNDEIVSLSVQGNPIALVMDVPESVLSRFRTNIWDLCQKNGI